MGVYVRHLHTMGRAVITSLVFLMISTPLVNSFRPYVTCVGCETFLQCFLTCPVADYPGVNRFGVYVPKFLRNSPMKTKRAPLPFRLKPRLRRVRRRRKPQLKNNVMIFKEK